MSATETFLAIALAVFVVLFIYQNFRNRQLVAASKLADDRGMLGEWNLRVHKQMVLPMKAEELHLWDSFDESEKVRHVNSIRAKILKRELFYHINENGDLVWVGRKAAVELGIYDPKTKKTI